MIYWHESWMPPNIPQTKPDVQLQILSSQNFFVKFKIIKKYSFTEISFDMPSYKFSNDFIIIQMLCIFIIAGFWKFQCQMLRNCFWILMRCDLWRILAIFMFSIAFIRTIAPNLLKILTEQIFLNCVWVMKLSINYEICYHTNSNKKLGLKT